MSLKSYQGRWPSLGKNTYIDDSAVLYGDINIADDVSIWPLVAARGDVNTIQIGKRSNIQDGSVLHVARPTSDNPSGFPLIIGMDVTVGHKVMLHGCIIGNRVLIGMGAIVMDGALISDDVILAAGSLVPPGKHLASGYLYLGNPAKPVRELLPNELTYLSVSAKNYVVLKDQYINEQDSH